MHSKKITHVGLVGLCVVLFVSSGVWLGSIGYASPEWYNAHTIEEVDEQTVRNAVDGAESAPPEIAPGRFVYNDSTSLSPEAKQAIERSIDHSPEPFVVPPSVLDPDEFVYPGGGGKYVYYVHYDDRWYQLETEYVIGDRCSTISSCLNRGIEVRLER